MPYTNTFIQVSPDSVATESTVPTSNRSKKPAHIIQYELLSENPYRFDHDQLIFEVFIRHKSIPQVEFERNRDQIWADLHSKEHPCLRASTLMKKFGWGAHYDAEGKIALYGVESAEYDRFIKDEATKKLLAMRSKR